MSQLVTPEIIAEYEQNGAVCLRGVFSQTWVDTVRKGIEYNRKYPSDYGKQLITSNDSPGSYFDDYCNWQRIEEFQDFVHNSPAAEIVGTLLGSKYISFYHEHVLIKDAGTTKETPWHHDQAYYPINGFKVCSIWMPVDPVPMEATIEFVAGSHLLDTWFYPKKFATSLNYEQIREDDSIPFEDVPSDAELRRKYSILKWAVEPGDCIVFHMRSVHGAPGNLSSSNCRRILSTRWLGDDAVIATRPWEPTPSITGGLSIGDSAVSTQFPLIWQQI